jgi:hypothetical protein
MLAAQPLRCTPLRVQRQQRRSAVPAAAALPSNCASAAAPLRPALGSCCDGARLAHQQRCAKPLSRQRGVACAALDAAAPLASAEARTVGSAALALALCNICRVCMSVAVLPIAAEFGWQPAVQARERLRMLGAARLLAAQVHAPCTRAIC